ncbi:hypothetical protein B0H34DRAFT_514307 [Crassisporium funariophilum]|nr:hypothetical protein B0H34DRAFT_514307 [Crassisporium funariophilum]
MGAYIWSSSSHNHAEANTPSSTNASLPTPPALRSSRVLLASPANSFGEGWYSPDASIPQPGAPLMKDLDSFTEGTGQGSFDFLPPVAAEDLTLALIFHPPEILDHVDDTLDNDPSTLDALIFPYSLALDMLPSPTNVEDAVLAWRENVVAAPPTLQMPIKRRRSITQDGEIYDERRTRIWSPTIESSGIDHMEVHQEGYLTSREEPEVPD